jgi:hypothetical protein
MFSNNICFSQKKVQQKSANAFKLSRLSENVECKCNQGCLKMLSAKLQMQITVFLFSSTQTWSTLNSLEK